MSRSDEEGFHPHPGDPWHPGWDDEVDDDVEPLVPRRREPEPAAEDRSKGRGRRGRRGRRKGSKDGEPVPPDDFAVSDDDLPEPSGWEAYDDELVAADLESVVPPGVPTWTEEGGPSVEFESAFTVGGDLGPDDSSEHDAAPQAGIAPRPAAEDGLDLGDLGLSDEPPPEAGNEEPTMLLDEIALPDVPDLSALAAPPEPDDAGGEDPLRRLDALLPAEDDEPEGEDSELLGLLAAAAVTPGDESVEEADDEGVLEIPAEVDVADLTRAAEDAAAAMRSRAAEMRQDRALEMVAGELGAVEVEPVPEPPPLPGSRPDGLQESLLSAGLELPEQDTVASDPGFTPEDDEGDFDSGRAPYQSVAPLPAGIDGGPRRVPVDPSEIAPVDDVDAALSAIAAEPIASADPDALAALRAIDEDDDLGDWHAYAEGEAVPFEEPPEVADPAEVVGDLGPPLVPSISNDDLLLDDDVEEPPVKRGLFGRRKGRREDAADAIGDDGWTAGAETDFEPSTAAAEWPDEPGMPAAGADDGWPPASAEAVAHEEGELEGEGWPPASVGAVAREEGEPEGDDWDDGIAGNDEADAFFAADDQSRRRRFGFRRGGGAAGDTAADLAPAGAGADSAAVPDGFGSSAVPGYLDPQIAGEPAGEVGEFGDDLGEDAAAYPAEAADGLGEAGPGTGVPPGRPAEVIGSPGGDRSPEGAGARSRPDGEPFVEPLSKMPLVDEGADRLEVTPIGSAIPESADDEADVEDEYGEWRGEGSRIPASWFADIDEDEIEIEDMRPVDADEEAPVLEAGGMFDVGDILDPLPDPEQGFEDAGEGLAAAESPPGYDEPGYEPGPPAAVEPPDLFEHGPADPGEEEQAPDLLGEAAALMSGESPAVPEPRLWDETVELDPADLPGSPPLPGGGAEAWDAPPLVAATEPPWGVDPEPDAGAPVAAGPPLDPNAAVYDVVEDDLDRAPVPDLPVAGPADPVDWSEEAYTGAATMEHRGLAEAVARASTEDTQLQALSAAMPGLEMGVVGFEDVEDLGTDEYYTPAPRSDLGARILTGLILVSLLFGSLWVSGGMLAGFIGVMVMIGLTEYFTTLRHKGYSPLVIFGYLGGVGALVGAWVWGPIAIPGAILSTTAVVFFFYAFASRRRDALVNGGLTVMGMAWVTGTVAFAMPIIASEDYRVLVFALVASTVAMDVGAYGFGRAWGSAQMSPVLSPNKSIEGLAGGIVLAIGVAIGIGLLMDPFDLRSGAALGLVVAVAAPLGDLAESMLKRSLGVKDMGAILPGHGGIMDRVDAFLFVIPPVWVLYQFLGYLS